MAGVGLKSKAVLRRPRSTPAKADATATKITILIHPRITKSLQVALGTAEKGCGTPNATFAPIVIHQRITKTF
jgi:hypothetical protein